MPLKQWPLITGMVSYGAIWSCSSVSQQSIISRHQIDWQRVARNAAVGALFIAPPLHLWYRVVNRMVPIVGRNWKTSVKIAALEQFCVGPPMITTFYFATGLLSGSSLADITKEWKSKFVPTYKVSWCFFPFMNFINHLFVPLHLKVIYQSLISFVWSNYLCLMHEKHKLSIEEVPN